jgi:hypothetical protein
MPRRWNAISLVTFSLAGVSAPAAAVAQAPAPGTYRVWLCAEACTPSDSSRAIGVATVVIVSDRAAAEESVRSVFAGLRAIGRTRDTGATDNVCFSVSRREPRVGSEELYFGLEPKGRTRWQYAATDGFSMRVYLSPDAGYSLRWAEPGPLARGEGWSFGWAGDTPYHRNAYFAARRTGEPDITQCT